MTCQIRNVFINKKENSLKTLSPLCLSEVLVKKTWLLTLKAVTIFTVEL